MARTIALQLVVKAALIILQCGLCCKGALAEETKARTTLRQMGANFHPSDPKQGRGEAVLIVPYWKGGDEGLSHLKDLPELESVLFHSSGVSDKGLLHLSGMNLAYLYLSESQVTHIGLAEVGKIKGLKTLVLRGVNFNDRCIAAIATLPELVELDLGSTSVTDKGIEWLKKIPQLKRVRLKECKISPAGVEELLHAGIDVTQ